MLHSFLVFGSTTLTLPLNKDMSSRRPLAEYPLFAKRATFDNRSNVLKADSATVLLLAILLISLSGYECSCVARGAISAGPQYSLLDCRCRVSAAVLQTMFNTSCSMSLRSSGIDKFG